MEVFLDLLHSSKLNNVSVDCSATNDLVKLLDTVVIKLEGGSEEDLAVLDQEFAGTELDLFSILIIILILPTN